MKFSFKGLLGQNVTVSHENPFPVISRPPLKAWFTVWDAIERTSTARIPALDSEFPEHANSIILEIVGAATPSWTLDIQGRTRDTGTYVAVDYVQIWQGGAAALANAQLSITDTTRRFYIIPNCPPFLQLVATRTTGSLTVLGAYTSEVFTQWLRTNVTGVIVDGNVAHDAVDAGNPISVGGVNGTPAAVAAGDRTRWNFDSFGYGKVVLAEPGANQVVDVYPAASDAITILRLLRTGAFAYGLAPDGAWDRLRALQDTAPGLGVLAAAPYTPGASDVKSIAVDIGATSATRATALTPTVGKKVRIISMEVVSRGLTTNPDRVGVYFGTGAAYMTTVGNAIAEFVPGTTGEQSMTWPDGGGPVGAVDQVVSWITETETELLLRLTFQYREE